MTLISIMIGVGIFAVGAMWVAFTALNRADRALGITTWTDLDTEIRIKLLKDRLGISKLCGNLVKLEPDRWYWLLVNPNEVNVGELCELRKEDGQIILTEGFDHIKIIEGADRIKGIAILKNFEEGI